jgi:hypothetical protein
MSQMESPLSLDGSRPIPDEGLRRSTTASAPQRDANALAERRRHTDKRLSAGFFPGHESSRLEEVTKHELNGAI